jgi:hypothetical protein
MRKTEARLPRRYQRGRPVDARAGSTRRLRTAASFDNVIAFAVSVRGVHDLGKALTPANRESRWRPPFELDCGFAERFRWA